ncbi:MAG: hypothetical protein C0456_20205 [Hyphomonas sp.]|nr:hypothetical protein [Hyphomonas sp.]
MSAPRAAGKAINAVRVRAPARLHFGFLDLNGGLGRRFGSIGLALDAPAVQLVARPAKRVSASGPEAERVRANLLAAAAYLDIGGVEVMMDDRDGVARFYDINALSNFVAKPMDVLGFDPHDRLVDYLIRQIEQEK